MTSCCSLRSSNKMTTEELFFDQPHHWLSARYDNQRRPVPTHLVMFDILLPEVQEFVTNHSYSEVSLIMCMSHDIIGT